MVVRVPWTYDDPEHSDAQSVCLEKMSDNMCLLEAPVGVNDARYRHAKRNVFTPCQHMRHLRSKRDVHRQQMLDDERRARHLVVGVVNNGHNHVALWNLRVGSVARKSESGFTSTPRQSVRMPTSFWLLIAHTRRVSSSRRTISDICRSRSSSTAFDYRHTSCCSGHRCRGIR